MQGYLAGRAGVFKGHCKGHSAKQITQKKRLSDFLTPAQKGQKEGSRFHPSKPAVILSGFVFSQFQPFRIRHLRGLLLELRNRPPAAKPDMDECPFSFLSA
jgi:hypothetical protein